MVIPNLEYVEDPAIIGFLPKLANSRPTVPRPVITVSQISIKFLVPINL